MRRSFLLAGALLLCGTAVGHADFGIDEVRAELRRAVVAGELTRDEAKALMREAVTAHRVERHARRDGKHAERDARKAERAARQEAR